MHIAKTRVEAKADFVLLLDDLAMRRAQLTAFLSDWAELEQVELNTAGMPEAEDALEIAPACVMLILSIGSVEFDHSPAMGHVVATAERHAQLPSVILAEAGSGRDAAMAFRAGARGYIPASMEPEVALRALSFILHGGHFFPPSALRLPRSPAGGGPEDVTNQRGAVIAPIYPIRRDVDMRRVVEL